MFNIFKRWQLSLKILSNAQTNQKIILADCKIPKKIIRKRVNDNQENKILKKESHPHKKDITKENDENRFKKGNILLMCAMKSTCEHS